MKSLNHTSKTFAHTIKDYTFWTLLLANIFVIFATVLERIALEHVLYIYFFQNIIIGLMAVFKILFYRGGFDKEKESGVSTKMFLTLFFIFHFGLFHLVYLVFLGMPSAEILISITPYLIFFLLNHLFSFFYFYFKKEGKGQIQKIFFGPYKRIVPMHLFIIFGFLSIGLINFVAESVFAIDGDLSDSLWRISGILFLLIIKTVVDIVSHIKEHYGKDSGSKRKIIFSFNNKLKKQMKI